MLPIFLLTSVAAAATSFNILSVRSGTPYDGGAVTTKNGNVIYGGGGQSQNAVFVLNDDGSLQEKQSQEYLTVDGQWFVTTKDPDTSFSLDTNRVAYKKQPSFGICPNDDGKIQFEGHCSDYVGVALQVVNKQPPGDSTSSAAGGENEAPATTSAVGQNGPTSSVLGGEPSSQQGHPGTPIHVSAHPGTPIHRSSSPDSTVAPLTSSVETTLRTIAK